MKTFLRRLALPALVLALLLTSCGGETADGTTPTVTTPALTTPTATTPVATEPIGDPDCHHVYENECDATTCTLCGFVRTAPGHSWHNYETRQTLVSEANCLRPAVYRMFCSRCQALGAEFESGGLGGHIYTGDCAAECSVCHTPREPLTVHTFDGNNLCTVCGHIATQDECSHSYAADCSTECSRCGLTREASHLYHHECSTACYLCGETLRPDARHSDANADRICDFCGLALSSPAGDSAPGDVDWLRP